MSAKYSLVEMGDAFIYKKSLPRSVNGRRFISDRRMRDAPLPPGIKQDRRKEVDRRESLKAEDLVGDESGADSMEAAPAAGATAKADSADDITRCRKLMDLGEYENAINCLDDATKGMSTDAESYFLLGAALEKMADFNAALEAFRKAAYCDDSYSLAYFHMASVLEEIGELKAAVKEYRNAAKSLSNDSSERWVKDLEAFDIESLINLCQWKIENLGGVED
jgi:tetratricopeptide (TPR) repeat protein